MEDLEEKAKRIEGGTVFRPSRRLLGFDQLKIQAVLGRSGFWLFDLPDMLTRAGLDAKKELREMVRLHFQFTQDFLDAVWFDALGPFLDALEADIHAIIRAPRGRYARCSRGDAWSLAWREEVKPQLPPQLLADLVLLEDEQLDAETLKNRRNWGRNHTIPNAGAYWDSLMDILLKIGTSRRKTAGWVQLLITEQGFDLDDKWIRFWQERYEEECRRNGQDAEKSDMSE